jgi:hypothetical protein
MINKQKKGPLIPSNIPQVWWKGGWKRNMWSPPRAELGAAGQGSEKSPELGSSSHGCSLFASPARQGLGELLTLPTNELCM